MLRQYLPLSPDAMPPLPLFLAHRRELSLAIVRNFVTQTIALTREFVAQT